MIDDTSAVNAKSTMIKESETRAVFDLDSYDRNLPKLFAEGGIARRYKDVKDWKSVAVERDGKTYRFNRLVVEFLAEG